MIFNKDIDRTLWMILYSDKKNKNDIIKFINSIPSELLEKVKEELEKRTESNKIKEITKATRDNLGVTSIYKVAIYNKEIKIKLTKWKNDKNSLEEKQELTLRSISLDNITEEDLIEYLGGYNYSYQTIIYGIFDYTIVTKCNSALYDIIDVMDDKLILQVVAVKDSSKVISFDIIPSEIELQQLNDKHILKKERRKK